MSIVHHLHKLCCKFTRYYFALLVVIIFLPTYSLINRPCPTISDDVTTNPTSSTTLPMTSVFPDPPCVVTATDPLQRGRVIGLKRMSAGRLGNDMFVYASLIGIAARNKMVPIYHCDALARMFSVTRTGSYVLNVPATTLIEESAFR